MGTENLTLETLAQFAWVLGRGLIVRFPKKDRGDGGNQMPQSSPLVVYQATGSGVARPAEAAVTTRVSSSS